MRCDEGAALARWSDWSAWSDALDHLDPLGSANVSGEVQMC